VWGEALRRGSEDRHCRGDTEDRQIFSRGTERTGAEDAKEKRGIEDARKRLLGEALGTLRRDKALRRGIEERHL
jgi:hypothetical protein